MDEIAKSYAMLSSLKQNVPNLVNVDTKWVDDFHKSLEMIEKTTGLDLQEFRVSQEEFKKEVSGGNIRTGQVRYSGRMLVERARLMMKLDAVLAYFQYQQSKPTKGQIGFSKS